jgi:Uma2 family endonuclease
MAIPKGDKDGLFTYKDYLAWPEDERWELINGVAYNMSPAPNRRHQGLLTYITAQFLLHFDGHPCHVYVSPFDVLLPPSDWDHGAEEAIDTVVQPDLVVICDSAKLTEQGCTGAPDFVVEILSPSTAYKDMEDKLRLYESRGVREYWIINPGNETLLIYSVVPQGANDPATPQQQTGFCKPVLFTREGMVEPRIFPDLTINLESVFSRE